MTTKVRFKRYNIHLTEEQIQKLQMIAFKRGMKPAEVVRDAVSRYSEAWDKKVAASAPVSAPAPAVVG